MNTAWIVKKLQESRVPQHMWDGICAYLLHGVPPGGFLCSIFENNFVAAWAQADDTNRKAMESYAKFLWHIPLDCYGSPEKVKKHLESFNVG